MFRLHGMLLILVEPLTLDMLILYLMLDCKPCHLVDFFFTFLTLGHAYKSFFLFCY